MVIRYFSSLTCPCGQNDVQNECYHMEYIREALMDCEEDNNKKSIGNEKGITSNQLSEKLKGKKKPGKDRRYEKMCEDLKEGKYENVCVCGVFIFVKRKNNKGFIFNDKINGNKHKCKEDIRVKEEEISNKVEKFSAYRGSPITRINNKTRNVQDIPGVTICKKVLENFRDASPPYISIKDKNGKIIDNLNQGVDSKERGKREDEKRNARGGKREKWNIFLENRLRKEMGASSSSKYRKQILRKQNTVIKQMKRVFTDIEKFDKPKTSETPKEQKETRRKRADCASGIIDAMVLRGKFLMEIAIMEDKNNRNLQLGTESHRKSIMEDIKHLDEKILEEFSKSSLIKGEDGENLRKIMRDVIDTIYKHNQDISRTEFLDVAKISSKKKKEMGSSDVRMYRKDVKRLIYKN